MSPHAFIMGALALKDLRHDWRSAACSVLALVAVITPALVLAGLRTGYVEGERRSILSDPRALGMRTSFEDLSAKYPLAWFDDMRARSDVRFVIPSVDLLGAQVDIEADRPGADRVEVELVPSGPGDPVLRDIRRPPEELGGVVLSAAAARRAGVDEGQWIRLVVERKGGLAPATTDAPGGGQWRMLVTGVVAEGLEPGRAAFVALPVVVGVDDYRAGYAVPELGWSGKEKRPTRESYDGFRLYARTIEGVLPLRDELEARGYRISSNAERIEDLQRAQRAFDVIAFVLGTLAGATLFLCLAASLWASVERKRRALAVMALLGFTRLVSVLFPVVQGLALAVLACVVSAAGFFAGAAMVRRAAATHGSKMLQCVLHTEQLALAFALVCFSALAASAIAAYRTASIEPGEGLRA